MNYKDVLAIMSIIILLFMAVGVLLENRILLTVGIGITGAMYGILISKLR